MVWKTFELKILYLSRKLNISMIDLMQWKFSDIIKALELIGEM